MTTERKSLILRVLQDHRGPACAITARAIGEILEIDERAVRSLISELIVQDDHGEIIASNGGDAFHGYPPGYFWATDWRQVDAYYQVLVSRMDEIRHRMSAAWAARNRLAAAPEGQERLL